jgi:hypothetical protein
MPKICTVFFRVPAPNRNFDWSAVDADTYDGAEDSATRWQIGYGSTEEAAIRDLLENYLMEGLTDA